jgi:hypothetical protein
MKTIFGATCFVWSSWAAALVASPSVAADGLVAGGGASALTSEAAFSFDLPAGPQFSDEQKVAQRESAKQVVALVLAAFSNGLDAVRIPPGDYRLGRSAGRDGAEHALTFKGLRATAAPLHD